MTIYDSRRNCNDACSVLTRRAFGPVLMTKGRIWKNSLYLAGHQMSVYKLQDNIYVLELSIGDD
jgi:hypothetical protein